MIKSTVLLLLFMQTASVATAQHYVWRQIWPPVDRNWRPPAEKKHVETDSDRRIRLVRERDAKKVADDARKKKERYEAEHNPPPPPPIKLWDNTNQKWIYPGDPSLNPFGLR